MSSVKKLPADTSGAISLIVELLRDEGASEEDVRNALNNRGKDNTAFKKIVSDSEKKVARWKRRNSQPSS